MTAPQNITLTIHSKRLGKTKRSLDSLPCVIGRNAACDVIIDDPSISGRHAMLSTDASGSGLMIKDLGSTNGITVEGARTNQINLDLPSEVHLGGVSVIISTDSASQAGTARASGYVPSPGSPDATCYYRRSGSEHGPFTWNQLRDLAARGVLHPKDLVWTGRDDNWLMAELVEGLIDDDEPEPIPADADTAADDGDGTREDTATRQKIATRPPVVHHRKSTRGDIVCPHCWHTFDVEDFLFIARHQDLIGDPVLGPEAQQRFLPSKFTPEGHAVDSAGLSCPDMACPRCRLRIPRAAAEMPPLFASIVGAPASGKSYFLTAMMWEMRNTLARNFAMAFTDTDAITNQIINDFEEELFLSSDPDELVALRKTELQGELYNQVILDGMVTNLLKPFMFSITPAEHHPDYEAVRERISRTLVLYDNAGEHFEPGMDSVDNPTTRHLIFSDTIFFLFDPTKDVRFRKLCKGKTDPQLAKGSRVQRQEVLLTEMINRIEKYSGKRRRSKSKKKLIIIVPKCDIWLDLLGYELPEHPWKWDPEYRTCALDVDCIMSTSFSVRSLLEEVSPELVASAESFTGEVLFLPNSALGTSPELGGDTGIFGVRPGDVKPFWIPVPMLYLFHRQGLTPVLRDELLPPRDLVDIDYTLSGEVVFVTVPGEEIPLQIPTYYAGYRLRCPRTGQWFQMPKL
ncbi:MAG: FHA domain-containing protein [Lentisphaeria bacterium]|nr:FHA domain-containing protein [Lentisphaeria bacterium]